MQQDQQLLLFKLNQKVHHHLLVLSRGPCHPQEDAFLASQNSLKSTDPLWYSN